MKEAIAIKNVGPLADIMMEDIRPFTVIIGPSGSGKSLLMKIISLMRFIYKRACVRSFLLNAGLKKAPFRIRLDSLLHDDLKYYLTRPGVAVRYTVTADSGNGYDIEIVGGKVKLPRTIPDSDLIFTKESWVSETRNIIASWKSNPANSKGSLGYYFYETMSDFDEAAAFEKNVDMDYIGAKMSVTMTNGVRRYMLAIPGIHDAIELRYASSGIQTSAPLSMLAQYFAKTFSFKEAKRRSVLSYLYETDQLATFHPHIELADIDSVVNMHVEEPELSLDPEAQIQLVQDMVRTAFGKAQNRMTLMFATHSPYIVNAINLIINKRTEKDAYIAAENAAAYKIFNGRLINLMSTDGFEAPLVDTSDLSAPMERIYNDYIQLKSTKG